MALVLHVDSYSIHVEIMNTILDGKQGNSMETMTGREKLKISVSVPASHRGSNSHTLSAAKIRKDAPTCSAVSVSAVSLVMKSMKDWKETIPVVFGSTSIIMRANSTSP